MPLKVQAFEFSDLKMKVMIIWTGTLNKVLMAIQNTTIKMKKPGILLIYLHRN